jgi:hypothetical protein
MIAINHIFKKKLNQPITACKQYCLAAGATQGNIAYTQTVITGMCQITGVKVKL